MPLLPPVTIALRPFKLISMLFLRMRETPRLPHVPTRRRAGKPLDEPLWPWSILPNEQERGVPIENLGRKGSCGGHGLDQTATALMREAPCAGSSGSPPRRGYGPAAWLRRPPYPPAASACRGRSQTSPLRRCRDLPSCSPSRLRHRPPRPRTDDGCAPPHDAPASLRCAAAGSRIPRRRSGTGNPSAGCCRARPRRTSSARRRRRNGRTGR